MNKLLHFITTPKLQNEADNIAAAQQDPAKFQVLYEKYFDEIFAFVHKKIRQQDISNDITSQVFLKAMLKIKSFQFRNVPFSSWLYKIASNEVNLYYRNNKKLGEVNIDEAWVHQLAQEFDYSHIEIEEQEGKLLKALEKLKSKDLLILRLRFYENCSFKEVGAKAGMSENNAKVKTYRILAKLKKILQKIK